MIFPLVLLALTLVIVHQKDQPLPVENIELPEDLGTWCPFTTFCNLNASHSLKETEKNLSKGIKPCCKPCSCARDCGLTRSCCTYDLDRFKIDEKLGTICKSLKSSRYDHQNDDHYYMIDKCPNQNDTCRNVKTRIFGTFYPVFSKTTEMIYYNPICASCNNQEEITPFVPTLSCPFMDNHGLLQIFEVLRGSNDLCSFRFIVPNDIEVSKHVCFPEWTTCYLNSDKSLQNKCSSFNATFTDRYSRYKNVYCYLCSHHNNLSGKRWIEEHGFCQENRPGRLFGDTSLAILLDKSTISSYEKHIKEETEITSQACFDNGNCLEKVCHTILCPEGHFLVGRKCKLLGSNWFVRIVKVYIKLTATKTSKSLHDLRKITSDQLAPVQKEFFTRPSLHDWQIELYYNLYENGTTVRYIIAAAYLRDQFLKPKEILSQIDLALNGYWKLQIFEKEYEFDATFNDFNLYYPTRKITTFYPFVGREPILDNFLLYSWSENFDETTLREGLIISKLYFCRQVDLELGEYSRYSSMNFQEAIYIKSSKKFLGNGMYKILKDHFGTMIGIRACLSDVVVESVGTKTLHSLYFFFLLFFELL